VRVTRASAVAASEPFWAQTYLWGGTAGIIAGGALIAERLLRMTHEMEKRNRDIDALIEEHRARRKTD